MKQEKCSYTTDSQSLRKPGFGHGGTCQRQTSGVSQTKTPYYEARCIPYLVTSLPIYNEQNFSLVTF